MVLTIIKGVAMDDKGLNDFIKGCSDKELLKFSENLDKLSSPKLQLLIDKLTYESKDRLRIIDVYAMEQSLHNT
jgi:hypothetical protein